MKVKIVSVHGQGDYEREFVLLRVVEDCDIGRYQLSDSTYTANGKVSNKVRHVYWFPDKDVAEGDMISLWTKPGKDQSTRMDSGAPLHRFYWGLRTAVWNDDGDVAVLQHVASWQFFAAKNA
jgi:hypothetical protein